MNEKKEDKNRSFQTEAEKRTDQRLRETFKFMKEIGLFEKYSSYEDYKKRRKKSTHIWS